ncbi:MAG TPA: hypothetical protein VL688_09720 [Verrucomicrobiae bacterium]|nr:hypothetical protein [Verrucomicrobiae bacterium]
MRNFAVYACAVLLMASCGKKTRPLIFTGLFLATLAVFLSSLNLYLAEDAHILMRFARNLAEGHGLTWNPGMDPVEGATSFLWTVLLAAFYKAGMGFEISVPLLNGLCLAAAGLAVFFGTARLASVSWHPGFVAAGILVFSPLTLQIRAGFETPLFALFMTTVVISFMHLDDPSARVREAASAVMAAAGLLLGLTRPEGVVFYAFFFAAGLAVLLPEERGQFCRHALLFFVMPGFVYFLWRWQYFGYLLPNTFYAKSMVGKGLFRENFSSGAGYLRRISVYMAPYLALILLGSARMPPPLRRKTLLAFLGLCFFPLLYFLIFQAQNIGHRFQMPVVPGLLFLAVLAAEALRPALKKAWVPAVLLGGFLLVLDSSAKSAAVAYDQGLDTDRILIGRALQPYAKPGRIMVVSEPGYLPYYSEWLSVDALGLYDETIAHRGLTEDYLKRLSPDLIMFHAVKGEAADDMGGRYWYGRWNVMVRTLHAYAEKKGYLLAAIIETGKSSFYWYYVKGALPDEAGILKAVTDHPSLRYYYRAGEEAEKGKEAA